MKLSIFENVNPLPSNKNEKVSNARFFSRPYLPKIVEFTTEEDLIQIITNNAWSPFVFKNARLQEDFVSTDFLVLDIDSGLSIEDAEDRILEAGVACLCLPTTSHSKEVAKFRLLFPLSRTIINEGDFLASMADLAKSFPEADKACLTDTARAYFGSRLDDGFWLEGDLLEPVREVIRPTKQVGRNASAESKIKVDDDIKELIKELYGEDRDYIPESVEFFIKNAASGIEGNWIVSLNRFVYVLALQDISYDDIYDLVDYLSPNDLDKRDIDTIDRAFRDGQRDKENE